MRADMTSREPRSFGTMPPGYQISIILASAADVLRHEQLLIEAARQCGYVPIRLPPGTGGGGTFTDPYLLWGNGSPVIRYYVEDDEGTTQMHVASSDQRVTDRILELFEHAPSGAN